MNINSVNISDYMEFGKKHEAKNNAQKRSLIDGRLLKQEEVLDDVYEYCRRQKAKEAKRKKNLPNALFNQGDINSASYYQGKYVPELLKALNELYTKYVVNDYAANPKRYDY